MTWGSNPGPERIPPLVPSWLIALVLGFFMAWFANNVMQSREMRAVDAGDIILDGGAVEWHIE